MADEGGDWFSGAAEPGSTEGPAKVDGDAPADEPKKEVAEDEFLDLDKLLLCKHWIRPKFLQYRYLYDYRHSYYNDVLDYLDKRNRGYKREIPRAQTWAERVLRNQSQNRSEFYRNIDEDTKHVTKTRLSGAFHRYHSREYINRRYTSVL